MQKEAKRMIEEGKESEFIMMMHNLERTLDEMMDKAKVEGKLEMIKKLLDLVIRDIPTLSKVFDLPEEETKKIRTN